MNKFALFTELQQTIRDLENTYVNGIKNNEKFVYFKLNKFIEIRNILTKSYIRLSNLIKSFIESMKDIISIPPPPPPTFSNNNNNLEKKKKKKEKVDEEENDNVWKPKLIKIQPKGKSGKIKAEKEKKEKKESYLENEKNKRKDCVLKSSDKNILKFMSKRKSSRIKTKTLYKLFQSIIQVFDNKIKPFESKGSRPRNSFKKLKLTSLNTMIEDHNIQKRSDIKFQNQSDLISFKIDNFKNQVAKIQHTQKLIQNHIEIFMKRSFIMERYKESFTYVKFIRDDERFILEN